LTITGVVPTPLEEPDEPTEVEESQASQTVRAPIAQEHEAIVEDLLRRVRYLLTLKGRPPLCLAGVEMFERLTEVETCLDTLLDHRTDSRLAELRQGLHAALNSVQADYAELRQAANWLQHIADLLDPEGKPDRSGAHVQRELSAYLEDIDQESQDSPRLCRFCNKIRKTTLNYTPGLFHCYYTRLASHKQRP
jgi:hypothetical protein